MRNTDKLMQWFAVAMVAVVAIFGHVMVATRPQLKTIVRYNGGDKFVQGWTLIFKEWSWIETYYPFAFWIIAGLLLFAIWLDRRNENIEDQKTAATDDQGPREENLP